jgi:hypothetical protein
VPVTNGDAVVPELAARTNAGVRSWGARARTGIARTKT